jgi:hypothetical protein
MPDLPAHPGADAESPPGASAQGVRRLRTAVIAVVVIVLLAVMITLHVTGVVGADTNG